MEISKSKRVLYSLWILPLVVPVVWAMVGIIFGSSLNMAFSVLEINSFFGALVPVSYLLGWLTSRERVDRMAFLIALTVYLAFFTASMVIRNIANVTFGRAYWITALCALMSCGAILAAFAIALTRRKGLILRALAHRAPGQSQPHAREEQPAVVDVARDRMSEQERFQSRRSVPNPQVQSSTIPAPRPSTSAQSQNPPRQTMASASRTLDANSCSDTELLALPGMSAPVARAIVSEREQNGPYQSLEDLVTRNGLKPHVVAAFIGNLTVSAPSAAHAGSQHVRILDL